MTSPTPEIVPPDPVSRAARLPQEWAELARDLATQLLPYRFGLAEVLTKVTILREELSHLSSDNPIEHVSSRMKSIASMHAKAVRLGITDPGEVIASLNDIAGVRIVCSFISDTYRVLEMITAQPDLKVLQVKDYVAEPKANGYRSIHLIVEIPVFLSSGVARPRVEVQIRTVAMDFWASVEHKIYYKFEKDIPEHLRSELHRAASVSHDLDERMQHLHTTVRSMPGTGMAPQNSDRV